jgi:hypothetical protein
LIEQIIDPGEGHLAEIVVIEAAENRLI